MNESNFPYTNKIVAEKFNCGVRNLYKHKSKLRENLHYIVGKKVQGEELAINSPTYYSKAGVALLASYIKTTEAKEFTESLFNQLEEKNAPDLVNEGEHHRLRLIADNFSRGSVFVGVKAMYNMLHGQLLGRLLGEVNKNTVYQKKEINRLERKVKTSAQYLEYIRFTDTNDTITPAEAGRILKIGRNRLLQLLRDTGYLLSSQKNWNQPSQTFINQGLFKLKAHNIKGEISIQPLITAKGMVKISKLLMDINEEERANEGYV